VKLILHIGSPKTGTSTLQETFANSRGQLLEHGVLYPDLDGRVQHHLACVYLRATSLPREMRQPGSPAPGALMRQAEARLATAVAEAQARGAHTLLLSSEYLFHPSSAEAMAEFARRMRALATDVTVACYLRDPVSWYLSSVAQVVRASHVFPRLQPLAYADVLDGFAREFPVKARRYDRAALQGGDIVSDFLASFLPEVPTEPILQRRQNRNQSLSAEGVDILWAYRKSVHEAKPEVFTKDSARLYRELRAADAEVGGAAPLAALAEVEASVLRMFEPQRPRLRGHGLDFDGAAPTATTLPPGWCPETPRQVLRMDLERRERLLNALIKRMINAILRAAAAGRAKA
jgi:hypothetical protein